MAVSLSPTVVCPSQICPKSLPESPGHDDQGPSTSASHTAVPRDSSLVSAGDRPVGAPSPPLPASPSAQQECEGAGQAAQPKHSLPSDQKLPVPPGRTARTSQSPKKPFNSIIEHLSAVLPGYSRYGVRCADCEMLPLNGSPEQVQLCPLGAEVEGWHVVLFRKAGAAFSFLSTEVCVFKGDFSVRI